MATLVNLTPHQLTVLDGEGNQVLVVPPSGTIARVAQRRVQVDTLEVDGREFRVNRSVFGEVTGLPAQTDGVYYVVSALLVNALPQRDDLLLPDEVVREGATVLGCRAFGRA